MSAPVNLRYDMDLKSSKTKCLAQQFAELELKQRPVLIPAAPGNARESNFSPTTRVPSRTLPSGSPRFACRSASRSLQRSDLPVHNQAAGGRSASRSLPDTSPPQRAQRSASRTVPGHSPQFATRSASRGLQSASSSTASGAFSPKATRSASQGLQSASSSSVSGAFSPKANLRASRMECFSSVPKRPNTPQQCFAPARGSDAFSPVSGAPATVTSPRRLSPIPSGSVLRRRNPLILSVPCSPKLALAQVPEPQGLQAFSSLREAQSPNSMVEFSPGPSREVSPTFQPSAEAERAEAEAEEVNRGQPSSSKGVKSASNHDHFTSLWQGLLDNSGQVPGDSLCRHTEHPDGAVSVCCPRCATDYASVGAPFSLKCHHTFCEACVDELSEDGQVECPECKVDTELTLLRRNFAVANLSPLNIHQVRLLDNSTLMEKLDACCPVCLENYHDVAQPFLLQCGHSVCHSCLPLTVSKVETLQLECPECRQQNPAASAVPNWELQRIVCGVDHLKDQVTTA